MSPHNLITLIIAAPLITACAATASQQEPPANAIRQSVETAPADLQLQCRDSVAEFAERPVSALFPVASNPTVNGGFDVTIASDSARYSCSIDQQANVISVTLL